MEDSDEFDEFLFDSITRYHTLQMFNLENVPHHLLELDDVSICVASQRTNGSNSKLLRLRLPKKLTLPPEEEGRCKENDFKILSGAYTQAQVYNIDSLQNENKVITSEYGVAGLNIYRLLNKSLESNIIEESLNAIPWTNPDFVILEKTNHVVCSKFSDNPLLLVDLQAQKKVKEVKHCLGPVNASQCDNRNNVKCQALGNHLIMALNTCTGDLFLHDLRTQDCFTNLLCTSEKCSGEIWTVSKHDSKRTEPNYFGIFSNRQSIRVFDKRNNSVLFQSVGRNLPKEKVGNLKFKFSEKEDMFSISGTDSNVKVFKIEDNNFSHVFTHDGHSPRNSSLNFVTDHIWLSVRNKELIISICDNKTLNCWEFNA